MIPKKESRLGLDLRLARKEAGLHQADVASMLRPPLDVHLVAAWERGLSQPTPSQCAQLQQMFERRIPALIKNEGNASPASEAGLVWDRSIGTTEFAAALRRARRKLGLPTVHQFAKLLDVPVKTLSAASRDELPVHVKFVVAIALGWEGRAGTLYGMLTALQRRKVDQIAARMLREDLYRVREISGAVPGNTRRRLDGSNYQWQKSYRLAVEVAEAKANQRERGDDFHRLRNAPRRA